MHLAAPLPERTHHPGARTRGDLGQDPVAGLDQVKVQIVGASSG